MPSLKKNVITLFLLLIVYSWFFIFHSPSPQLKSLKVLGAETNVTLFTQPESGRGKIIDAINNAQKEILVEMYLLSDKQIIQALEQARERGVIVDVMLEEHPFGGGNLNKIAQKTLDENGVSVKWTNSAFSLTHEKAIVIDQNEAFILNQNLTASSFSKNREYDVVDTNSEDVSQIRTIFIKDWERKTFTPGASHLIVSPNTSRPALTTLITSAERTIDIEIEVIDDRQVVSLLSDKAKKMQVRLIAPTLSQISSNSDALTKLAKGGVLIRTLSSPYLHAKLILVDDQKAYIGSINLSTQSLDQNRELGIMLSESASIQTLSSTFQIDWDKGEEFMGNN